MIVFKFTLLTLLKILLSINSTMPLGTPKDIMNLLEQKEGAV